MKRNFETQNNLSFSCDIKAMKINNNNYCITSLQYNYFTSCRNITIILNNYPPKGRWIVVDIYRDAKRQAIYPPLFTDPEGDSCFSIYQIWWTKKIFFNFIFWNFRETTHHFSLRSQNSEYPRMFQVTGANQNAQKLLSTDLVNTKSYYLTCHFVNTYICKLFELTPEEYHTNLANWRNLANANSFSVKHQIT